jgi:hypothetical protein
LKSSGKKEMNMYWGTYCVLGFVYFILTHIFLMRKLKDEVICPSYIPRNQSYKAELEK